MKKNIMIVLVLLLAFGTTAIAQQKSKVVSLDLMQLDPEVRKAIEADMELKAQKVLIEKDINTYAEWAGQGKEIGLAVSEGLNAVKDVTLELAESRVGEVTIWLIIWKVAGIDFVRIFFGMIWVILTTVMVSRSYFRTFKKGEGYSNSYWRYPNAAAACHAVVFMIAIGLSAVVMFA